MKKALLGTSAIALAAMAAPANAAEWDVRVGGYYNAMVAYADTNGNGVGTADFSGVDVSTEAEIFFLPSITLDNGIRIGANVQLEGETEGDQIDESFVFIDGSFGRVLLGSENSAGYIMHYGAPNAAIISISSPSTPDYIAWTTGIDSVGRGTMGTTRLEVGTNNDAKRITYFTPRFAGFQLGVSYAHDGNQDNFGPTNIAAGSGALANIFDVAANYDQTFGDFTVRVSARWGTGSQKSAAGTGGAAVTAGGALVGIPAGGTAPAGSTTILAPTAATPASTPTVLGFGAQIGYAGFTLGGAWAESNNHNGGVDDGIAYEIGATYATGPWTFGFMYIHGENGEPGVTAADKVDTFSGAVNYDLAQGVRLNLFGAYVDSDRAGTANDRDGWVIGTGIGLSF